MTDNINIDRLNGDLLSSQVERWIERKIIYGEYKIGEKIPSESQLASELRVSRPTIKSAVSSLTDRKILECRPSVGSFVQSKPPPRVNLKNVAVILPNISDPFLHQLAVSLSANLKENNYSMVLIPSDYDFGKEQYHMEHLHYYSEISGCLIDSCEENEVVVKMDKLPGPTVFVCMKPKNINADFVTLNQQNSVKKIVDYFVSLGHTEFGYIRGKLYPDDDTRGNAFRKELKARKMKVNPDWFIASNLPDETGGEDAMKQLLKLKKRPTAVFAESDTTAIGAMLLAQKKGLKIPLEMSICGFDNIRLCDYLKIPLTTVEFSTDMLAQKAVRLLLDRIEHPEKKRPIRKELVPSKLIIRESCDVVRNK